MEAYFPGVVGLEFTKIEPGRSTCQVKVHSKLHNPGGVLRGGVPYALADTGMAMAILSDVGFDKNCTTIEVKITYFKPVREGVLSCNTKVIRKTRRWAFLESEIFNGDGDLAAKASATFCIIDEAQSHG
jgi:acyl-CoA thioesterase